MTHIAFIGLGTMGQNVTRNLMRAGYKLTVYNRTPGRADEFLKAGAYEAVTPAEAVKNVDVIMIMVSDDAAVNAVVFGKDGVLEGVESNQIVIDLTTVHPRTSLKEAEAFNNKGVEFLDAPVFGSKAESRDAGLWIVIGGKKETYEQILPIFKVISETQHYMGGNGKGSSMKLVGNLVVATQINALGESMVLAQKAGLNPKDVLGVFEVTDFKSPILSGVGDALCRRDFSPSFYLKLMLKDANLILDFAEDLNVPIPVTSVIRETIKTAVNRGWGELNASAFIKVLEENASVEVSYRDIEG